MRNPPRTRRTDVWRGVALVVAVTASVAALLTHPVDLYAHEVASGVLPAGKYHRLACERHLRDRARETGEGFPYRFDPCQADRFIRFAANLKHYKGKQFAGKPIELTPVQQFRLGSIFGWRHVETGLRRFTKAYNELPRKSGKTLEAAIVAIYVTFFEGEPGAEGYTIATKRAQAKLVFDAARKLVRSSGLRARVDTLKTSLYREQAEQKLEPLGADADSTDGLNPYLIVTDEYHAHKSNDLVGVMESGTGARLSFLHFIITTAGVDLVSPCGEEHDYVCKILDQVLTDEATEAIFAFIAHADEGDDWLDERTWRKANPHYGISVNPEDFKKLALEAKNIPSKAAEFKQKKLNIWGNETAPCLSVEGWRNGQSTWVPTAPPAELEQHSCYVGIDLASKIDLCAMTLAFPPAAGRTKWVLLQRIWTPEATLKERARRDRVPYEQWVKAGWLRTTPGTKINHDDVIRSELAELRTHYTIERIGYDPWHAGQLVKDLVEIDGFAEDQVLEVRQTFSGMSLGCLELQAEILGGNVDAGGCPVTAWSVSNTKGEIDGKENLMFSKKKSRGRIDPAVAPAIAISLWKRFGQAPASIYQTRGVMGLGDY